MAIVKGLKRGWGFLGPVARETLNYSERGFTRIMGRLFLGYLVYVVLIACGMMLGDFVADVPYATAGVLLVAYVVGVVVLMAATVGAIQNIYHGKNLPFFTSRNIVRGVKIAVPYLAIALVFWGLFGMALLNPGDPAVSLAAIGLALLFGVLVLPVYLLLYYFMQEGSVTSKGMVGSIKGSVSLVRKNFWETIMFGIAVTILLSVVMFIFYVILYLGAIVGAVVSLGVVASLGDAGTVAMMVMWGAFVLVMLAVMIAVMTIYLVAQTVFYRKLVQARMRKAA